MEKHLAADQRGQRAQECDVFDGLEEDERVVCKGQGNYWWMKRVLIAPTPAHRRQINAGPMVVFVSVMAHMFRCVTVK